MKKIIKSKKIKYLVFTMLGIIIGSSIGITANYLLRAEDVEYVDKDNNSTTVQSAITDLYNKAKNGGFETLPIGTVTKTHNSITIPYTGSYGSIYCVYGIGTNYGSVGTIKNNNCEMKKLTPKTAYDYKIIAADSTGKVYEGHGTIETDEAPAVEYYSNPSIVYFNPVTNTTCNNYTSSNSIIGTKTGCMKWYAYKREGNNYSLLLDHNTTAEVAYNTTNDNENYGVTSGNVGYDLALLTTSTSSGGSGWNSNLNPRLISADEIKEITGNTDWNSGGSPYYLNGNSNKQEKGSNIYKWLFDRTYNCTDYGADTDDSVWGYWTSTPKSDNSCRVWAVSSGSLLNYFNANDPSYGLRPVIEVPSSLISPA